MLSLPLLLGCGLFGRPFRSLFLVVLALLLLVLFGCHLARLLMQGLALRLSLGLGCCLLLGPFVCLGLVVLCLLLFFPRFLLFLLLLLLFLLFLLFLSLLLLFGLLVFQQLACLLLSLFPGHFFGCFALCCLLLCLLLLTPRLFFGRLLGRLSPLSLLLRLFLLLPLRLLFSLFSALCSQLCLRLLGLCLLARSPLPVLLLQLGYFSVLFLFFATGSLAAFFLLCGLSPDDCGRVALCGRLCWLRRRARGDGCRRGQFFRTRSDAVVDASIGVDVGALIGTVPRGMTIATAHHASAEQLSPRAQLDAVLEWLFRALRSSQRPHARQQHQRHPHSLTSFLELTKSRVFTVMR